VRRPELLLALAAGLACLLCRAPSGAANEAAAPDAQRVPIFDAHGGLGPGWQDLGWAPRKLEKGAPASIDFSDRAGWIVAHPSLSGSFAWLSFRLGAPASYGSFLEVGLDSAGAQRFPHVRLTPERGKPVGDALEYQIGMSELNPKGAPFDRVVFQAFRDVGRERVRLDEVALVVGAVAAARAPERPLQMSIQCAEKGRPISPQIFGIAGTGNGWHEMGATARRWGGNPNSRYNWEHGSAWNAASDWFFRNVSYVKQPGPAWQRFLDENRERGLTTALTVPMLGWVAKDTSSYSFPVSVFGPQQATAPEDRDVGNGVAPNGELLQPRDPERTSVRAPPAFIARWIAAINRRDEGKSRSVQEYILDNEPTLWSTTHRDVHPEPVSYDELWQRTLDYGTAVRQADPKALIAGPAAWGFTALFYSGQDMSGKTSLHLDRLLHGNKPLLPWWLRKVRDHEKKAGVRLIDVVDVHFYPQSANIGIGPKGGTDPETAALRIRSTRALWDPSYVDESWINEPVRLIPRLREWIREEAPGLGISIGEYNFGAEEHMSGGLAVAEALGRFAEQGLASAYYWTDPPKDSPAFWAFRAYRNFDGKGGRFLDELVPAQDDLELASVFASRDGKGHVVAVLLNLDPATAAQARVDLSECGQLKARRAFTYTGARTGFAEATDAGSGSGASLVQRLPPYSMTVLDLQLDPPRAEASAGATR
jgi:hypothetical protein